MLLVLFLEFLPRIPVAVSSRPAHWCIILCFTEEFISNNIPELFEGAWPTPRGSLKDKVSCHSVDPQVAASAVEPQDFGAQQHGRTLQADPLGWRRWLKRPYAERYRMVMAVEPAWTMVVLRQIGTAY